MYKDYCHLFEAVIFLRKLVYKVDRGFTAQNQLILLRL